MRREGLGSVEIDCRGQRVGFKGHGARNSAAGEMRNDSGEGEAREGRKSNHYYCGAAGDPARKKWLRWSLHPCTVHLNLPRAGLVALQPINDSGTF